MAKMKITKLTESNEYGIYFNDGLLGYMKQDDKGWVIRESSSRIWSSFVFEDRKEAALELKRSTEVYENYDAEIARLKKLCAIKPAIGKIPSIREMRSLFNEKETTTLSVKDFLKE